MTPAPKDPAAMALEEMPREDITSWAELTTGKWAVKHHDTIRKALAQMQDAQGVEVTTFDLQNIYEKAVWENPVVIRDNLEAFQIFAKAFSQKYSGKRIEITEDKK